MKYNFVIKLKYQFRLSACKTSIFARCDFFPLLASPRCDVSKINHDKIINHLWITESRSFTMAIFAATKGMISFFWILGKTRLYNKQKMHGCLEIPEFFLVLVRCAHSWDIMINTGSKSGIFVHHGHALFSVKVTRPIFMWTVWLH